MSAREKATYKGALAAAMDSGAYIKFVEIHTEMKSEMEAHKQCMFIYWHRFFLVVFENMLRGQGPKFACVTVPYFNWMAASNKALTGECRTLGECSPILRELGGYAGNSQKTVTINGAQVAGNCVTTAPLNHFCQSSSSKGSACARCLPRGNWGSAKVPASVSYASVIGQVFNGTNIDKVSRTVEPDIHSILGSTMTKFQSPADPIFWSHHAMLDALLTIFHKCRVGTRRMTFAQKAADPVAWASCKRRVGGKLATGPPFKPTDIITMRTGEHGKTPIEGRRDPLIGRFFRGVPNRFADMLDGSDLGSNSYTYEISGLLATMYKGCGGMPKKHNPPAAPASKTASPPHRAPVPRPTTRPPTTPRRPSAVPPPHRAPAPRPTTRPPTNPRRPSAVPPPHRAPVSRPTTRPPTTPRRPSAVPPPHRAPAPRPATRPPPTTHRRPVVSPAHKTRASTTAAEANFDRDNQQTRTSSSRSFFDWLFGRGRRRLATCRTATADKKKTDEKTTTLVVSSPTGHEDLIIASHFTRPEKRMMNWYNETMTSNGGKPQDNIADMERQMCMFQDLCLGGIVKYTEEFKALWGFEEPRCRTIVNAINNGEQKILDSSWKQKMEAHFGCPHPANETIASGGSDGKAKSL
ncbi:hypothetical protein PF005_g27780 [Phytophthora fragariae]|uniref:Tyrosinase copper-binding domain-containing protein n=1 Tax=Phytophthora fragariae TaxID=53985 RepID=A0A6A3Q4B5_9STRA|nr:hypothetical protein PF003_g39571 [Phytophthora fragariae]KAE8921349.1 hypothetical protein PF009_g28369 [Phytophthora fragariae]KAE9068373.1 hypothetical protein PF007_g27713 [Phytophthora fragariae]KAE9080234.1 hypothetical protein PF006_g27358 [Phytophthora fragariae]KAE9169894.1 hypothetical protein PF005_g27780 [Phytophthora fragariae]